MKKRDNEQRTLQNALEKLTLEETVALTREFERILKTGDIKTATPTGRKKRRQEPLDRNGRALKLGQRVEVAVGNQQVRGKVKRLGKRASIEVKNRPIIVRAFHNVEIVEKSEK